MSGVKWMIGPVALLSLLVVLGWLQYQWVGQVGEAEQERMRASLESSSRRFADDVTEEMFFLLRYLRLDGLEGAAASLVEGREVYVNEVRYPELLSGLYVYSLDGALLQLDDDGELVEAVWPEAFRGLKDKLEDLGQSVGDRRRGQQSPVPVVWRDPLAVAVPIAWFRRGRPPAAAGFTVATFDELVIRDTILPELAARHFGPDYDVVVVDRTGEVFYSTTEASELSHPDAEGDIPRMGRFLGRPDSVRGKAPRRPFSDRGDSFRGGDPVRWRFMVRHQEGSLEEAVARARARNLVVSFGILGLLAASIVLVAAATRRATELNNQKMEFIAGVSHELRTPVAVLRSAGQNLADGSVSGKDQVLRYGELIESEGRRLNDLVEQVLELSGIQSQKRRYRRDRVAVEDVIEEAVSDCDDIASQRGVAIDTSFETSGLTMAGDHEALRRALANLITNAVKHGGDENSIELRAEERPGSLVALSVSDRGPGIVPKDQVHVFDAFYRGARAQERQVAGSGLGLSLVRHIAHEHGGDVTLDARPGGGCRFTLLIPKYQELG